MDDKAQVANCRHLSQGAPLRVEAQRAEDRQSSPERLFQYRKELIRGSDPGKTD